MVGLAEQVLSQLDKDPERLNGLSDHLSEAGEGKFREIHRTVREYERQTEDFGSMSGPTREVYRKVSGEARHRFMRDGYTLSGI